MEKQVKKSAKAGFSLADRLRAFCGEITPGKRLAFILAVLAVCTAANLYITFKAVYNMGRGRLLPDTGHIGRPGPVRPSDAAVCDTLIREGGNDEGYDNGLP